MAINEFVNILSDVFTFGSSNKVTMRSGSDFISLRNVADDAYLRMKGLTPVDNEDFATKGFAESLPGLLTAAQQAAFSNAPSTIDGSDPLVPKSYVDAFAGGNISNTGNGYTSVENILLGSVYSSQEMTTTNKYTPAYWFGSTDGDFTTENPKILAGIAGYAGEDYSADTDSAMGISFFTTAENGGATPVAIERMRITPGGDVEFTENISVDGSSIVDSEKCLRVNSPAVPSAITNNMAGVELYGGKGSDLVTAGTLTPMMKFGWSDTDLSTNNPKLTAGIVGRATEVIGSDVDGGTALDFYISADNPGATPTLDTPAMILSSGGLNVKEDFAGSKLYVFDDDQSGDFTDTQNTQSAGVWLVNNKDTSNGSFGVPLYWASQPTSTTLDKTPEIQYMMTIEAKNAHDGSGDDSALVFFGSDGNGPTVRIAEFPSETNAANLPAIIYSNLFLAADKEIGGTNIVAYNPSQTSSPTDADADTLEARFIAVTNDRPSAGEFMGGYMWSTQANTSNPEPSNFSDFNFGLVTSATNNHDGSSDTSRLNFVHYNGSPTGEVIVGSWDTATLEVFTDIEQQGSLNESRIEKLRIVDLDSTSNTTSANTFTGALLQLEHVDNLSDDEFATALLWQGPSTSEKLAFIRPRATAAHTGSTNYNMLDFYTVTNSSSSSIKMMGMGSDPSQYPGSLQHTEFFQDVYVQSAKTTVNDLVLGEEGATDYPLGSNDGVTSKLADTPRLIFDHSVTFADNDHGHPLAWVGNDNNIMALIRPQATAAQTGTGLDSMLKFYSGKNDSASVAEVFRYGYDPNGFDAATPYAEFVQNLYVQTATTTVNDLVLGEEGASDYPTGSNDGVNSKLADTPRLVFDHSVTMADNDFGHPLAWLGNDNNIMSLIRPQATAAQTGNSLRSMLRFYSGQNDSSSISEVFRYGYDPNGFEVTNPYFEVVEESYFQTKTTTIQDLVVDDLSSTSNPIAVDDGVQSFFSGVSRLALNNSADMEDDTYGPVLVWTESGSSNHVHFFMRPRATNDHSAVALSSKRSVMGMYEVRNGTSEELLAEFGTDADYLDDAIVRIHSPLHVDDVISVNNQWGIRHETVNTNETVSLRNSANTDYVYGRAKTYPSGAITAGDEETIATVEYVEDAVSSGSSYYVAQSTPPADTTVLWLNTSSGLVEHGLYYYDSNATGDGAWLSVALTPLTFGQESIDGQSSGTDFHNITNPGNKYGYYMPGDWLYMGVSAWAFNGDSGGTKEVDIIAYQRTSTTPNLVVDTFDVTDQDPSGNSYRIERADGGTGPYADRVWNVRVDSVGGALQEFQCTVWLRKVVNV